MDRANLGRFLIVCGWGFYLVALFCPAIKYEAAGLDNYGGCKETKLGLRCFLDTFEVGNWLFAPPLFFFAGANVLMIGSLFSFFTPRKLYGVWGTALLACFVVSLLAPWCAHEVKGVRIGCFLWMLSFLNAGVGSLLAFRDEVKPGE